MPRATVQDGIELEYEMFGDQGEPLVLIMGVGAQMVLWDEELCRSLVRHGFRVIRFDNRDIGRSTWLDHLGVPPVRDNLLRATLKRVVNAPYDLSDMARDVLGLLDHLGLERAHFVGASMGGRIAQQLAIEHPERVLSLTSIMSWPGTLRHMLFMRPSALSALLAPPPRTVEQAMAHTVNLFRTIGGALPIDEARVRRNAAQAWERGAHPAGFARQWSAILATGNRVRELRGVRAPTLVIHGTVDPLIPPAGGRATAAAIQGARLEMVEGMGHFIPRVIWPRLVALITGHIRIGP